MGSTYYAPGDRRAERVNDLFASIAPHYDLINDLQSFGLHRLWKRELIRLTNPAPGNVALDLCCGTGDLALALAQRGVRVMAVDASESMLEKARARVLNPAGQGHVEWIAGNALQLPFEAGRFDLAVVGYGLRNLPSVEAGLAELCRVVKPDGTVAILDFGKPDHRIWRALFFAYLELGVPILGWLFARNRAAYAYILESLRHYPAPRQISVLMEKAGFNEVTWRPRLGGAMAIHVGKKR